MSPGKEGGDGERKRFHKLEQNGFPGFEKKWLQWRCCPHIHNGQEKSGSELVELCAVLLCHAVFQAFPGVNVKCNCSFDLYLLSPQVWGRATLVDYCRNERHSDLVGRMPCRVQCCPLCWRQATPGERLESVGELLSGQPASKGFIILKSVMAKQPG